MDLIALQRRAQNTQEQGAAFSTGISLLRGMGDASACYSCIMPTEQ
jgi:hypothetical protein